MIFTHPDDDDEAGRRIAAAAPWVRRLTAVVAGADGGGRGVILVTPTRTRARAIDAITDGVRRSLEAARFVRQLAAGTDAESRWQGRRVAEARALTAGLSRDAERREDDEALRTLARLETELACLARMIDHEGTAPLSVVRDDRRKS
jgi:hypothetical protein